MTSPAVAIILNGISRKKKKFREEIVPRLQKEFSIEIFETRRAGDAVHLSRAAVENKFDFVIAAGGDGTLNQVLNGALSAHADTLPILGLIPLGSGNDFAKMCGLRPDATSLIELIRNHRAKPIDVGKIICRDEKGTSVTRYFLNACSIGMGPAVVKRLEKNARSWGPFLTYWKAITTTFFTHRPQEIICDASEWSWRGKIRVLVVANGRSFGNSLFIAPEASTEDGIFNTFIAGEVPLFNFLIYQQTLKTKAKIKDPLIIYNHATNVSLSAPESCPIETEGEIAGLLPASIVMIPGAIRFLR